MRGNVAHPELLQDAAEVGGMLGALQLLGERPVAIGAHEDVEAIAVEGQRHPWVVNSC
jgi:hypothetical protein